MIDTKDYTQGRSQDEKNLDETLTPRFFRSPLSESEEQTLDYFEPDSPS